LFWQVNFCFFEIEEGTIDMADVNWIRHAIEDTVHDTYGGWRNEKHSDKDKTKLENHIIRKITKLGYPALYRSDNEDKYVGELEGNEILDSVKGPVTYEEILRGDDLTRQTVMSSIKISSEGFDIKTASKDQLSKIASFILNYLFGSDKVSSYFTIDTSKGKVTKIFNEHPTARGLITPQNIGDSANTCLRQFGDEPNLYAFPIVTDNKFISRWNTFSQDFMISYENNKFSQNNTFGFIFNFTSRSGKNIPYTFGPKEPEGASLDYLLNLTLAAEEGRELESIISNGCLNIGNHIQPLEEDIQRTIKNGDDSPFLDMKRAGDADQADAAFILNTSLKYVVLVTIDRLLSVQARLMKQSCILENNDTITIFRGTMPDIDPSIIAAHEAARINRYIEKHTENYNKFTDPKFMAAIETFAKSLLPSLSVKLGILDTVKILLDIKLKSIYSILSSFVSNARATALPITPTPNEDNINKMIAIFNSISISKSDIESFISTFETPFNIKKGIDVLKYSLKPYKALSSAVVALWAKVSSTRKLRAPINYFTLANEEGGYNKSLDEILESMPPIPAEVRPPQILDNQTTADDIRPIIASFNPKKMSGGKRKQSGGVLDAGLSRVRATIFKEICSSAATYIRNTLSPHITNIVALTVLQTLKYSALKADAAGTVNLATAQQYFPEINPGNLDATIASQTILADAETSNILRVFSNDVESRNVISFLEELQFKWTASYLEDIGEDELKDASVWWQILNPYLEDNTINGGHIFSTSNLARDPLATKYLPVCLSVPELPSLLTLAIVNDILEGSVGRETSVFTQLFVKGGIIPRGLGKIHIETNAEWTNLQRLIVNIYRSISTGEIGREIFTLYGGSKTRLRRRKRKSSPRRKTLRKTRKHK